MRHLVYLLVLANVIYLGWNLLQEQTAGDIVRALPPGPAGVHRLVTLQEHTSKLAEPTDATGINALTLAEPPGSLQKSGCMALGPFTAKDEAMTFSSRLQGLGLDPVLRPVESRVENGFWIYLQGRDKAHARRIVQQLKDKGDREYYVGKANMLYLGTFDTVGRAEIRLEQLRKQGIEAILDQRYKTSRQYWLEMTANGTVSEVLEKILAGNGELQIHTLSCM